MKQSVPFLLLVITIFLFTSPLLAQPLLLKGKVANLTSKDPVQGATIAIKNFKTATSTNSAGEFAINGKPGDVIVISYVGFESKSVKATGEHMEIPLTPSSSVLNAKGMVDKALVNVRQLPTIII